MLFMQVPRVWSKERYLCPAIKFTQSSSLGAWRARGVVMWSLLARFVICSPRLRSCQGRCCGLARLMVTGFILPSHRRCKPSRELSACLQTSINCPFARVVHRLSTAQQLRESAAATKNRSAPPLSHSRDTWASYYAHHRRNPDLHHLYAPSAAINRSPAKLTRTRPSENTTASGRLSE
ncbi:hypothetical protein EJ03DRAFT_44566 [Teratosphaeria nubilosa]|uniref:Uncharacterized protein n=1 Tax=Teratosphaeria nubilosa TaxID=161662 RepID=A0A6G1LDN2_9PEZI|nr:hypothetical protein EJ03DRAFT_44566 [Teratosphaeria nubilosa]